MTGINAMKRESSKEKICQIFWEIFSAKTISEITVQEISDACHIHRNTFYFYYPNIKAVLEEIEQDLFGHLIDFKESHSKDKMQFPEFSQLVFKHFSDKREELKILIVEQRDYYFAQDFLAFLDEIAISMVTTDDFSKNSPHTIEVLKLLGRSNLLYLLSLATDERLSSEEILRIFYRINSSFLDIFQEEYHILGIF